MDVVGSESVAVLPAAALRPLIRSYEGFSYRGLDAGTHQGLPSGFITFIVSFDGPTRVAKMPGGHGEGVFFGLVGGLHSRPATVAHPGHGAGISIRLSPFATRTLLGVPAASLAGSVVELSELVGPIGTRLLDRLHAATSWSSRFLALDEVLMELVADSGPMCPEVVRAWQLLAASRGRARIRDLADDVGWSQRHLSTRFGAELGLSPKKAARILRFEHACELFDQGLDGAEVAASAGYYDQPHMHADWREFADATPLEWLADKLRDRTVEVPLDRERSVSDFSKTSTAAPTRMH